VEGGGHEGVRILAEHLLHPLVGEGRPPPVAEVPGLQHPSGRRVVAGDRLDGQREGERVGLQAAEGAGKQHPEEPCLAEGLHDGRRDAPAGLGRPSVLADDRADVRDGVQQ
jgi:hypothetical protein